MVINPAVTLSLLSTRPAVTFQTAVILLDDRGRCVCVCVCKQLARRAESIVSRNMKAETHRLLVVNYKLPS